MMELKTRKPRMASVKSKGKKITQAKPDKATNTPSPLLKKTIDNIYWFVATCVFAGVYNVFFAQKINILSGVIFMSLGGVLFFTNRLLQKGDIRSLYTGSVATMIVLYFVIINNARLLLPSMVFPAMFYYAMYTLWKNGELK